jgi:hypothetical protein
MATGGLVAWLLFAPASPMHPDSARGEPAEGRIVDRMSPEGF